ncbi:MAG: hypothetical protein LBI69_01695, partial [Puniceicoccales bacterium]|nr:hypothetical protein [Puniceicoccales bacterium]
SNPIANVNGAGYKPYAPTFGYRNRNSMVAMLNYRHLFCRHWEFVTHWQGNFNGTYKANQLSASIGYNF